MSEENKLLAFINTELKKFSITDLAIAELSKYKSLTIKNIDDKDGYKAVKEARLIVKRHRVDVEKLRKELTSDALEYQRRINSEAKRITIQLEEIEQVLGTREDEYESERERIKREQEQAAAVRYQTRVKQLTALQFKFDGVNFTTEYLDTFNNEIISISVDKLKEWDDQVFNQFIENAQDYFNYHQQQLNAQRLREEAEKKAEADRLAQQRKEQEAERLRLEAIAQEQAAKAAALKAEQERIENQKKADQEAVLKSEQERLIQQRREQELEQERLADIAWEEEQERIANAAWKDAQERLGCPYPISLKTQNNEEIEVQLVQPERSEPEEYESDHERGYHQGFLSALKVCYELVMNFPRDKVLAELEKEIKERQIP